MMKLPKDERAYALYRAEEVNRLLNIAKITIERRLAPDAVVDEALIAVEIEIGLLISSLKKD